jgi:hypothetical protein
MDKIFPNPNTIALTNQDIQVDFQKDWIGLDGTGMCTLIRRCAGLVTPIGALFIPTRGNTCIAVKQILANA